MSSAFDELARTVASGEAILFTGAGFSGDARDVDRRPLPDGKQMLSELWPLCFPDCEPDDSTLPDLYDAALLRAPDALREYTARRLRIGDEPLPDHLAAWFSAPWQRIYTLNVDDLEAAIQRQYTLPRTLRTLSALAETMPAPDAKALDVVHLNGLATEGADALTFSTLQYASRLCGHDREYRRLAEDLERSPFVFAGTSLDEIVLWQHVELHRRKRDAALGDRPTSYLVSTHLSRARQVLLEAIGIRWVEATIEEAAGVLAAR